MSRREKIQLKIALCLMGIILLFVLAVIMLVRWGMKEPKPPVHIPAVERFYNVWITEVTENEISIFDGENRVFPFSEEEKEMFSGAVREQIADITLTDGVVSGLKIKTERKLSGKVLRVIAGSGVEIEGEGIIPFAENVKMYQLYDTLKAVGEKEIRVGYNFCDFVLEDGKVCGVLVTRDEAMEYIRVQIKTSDYRSAVHDRVRFFADTDFVLRYTGAEGAVEEFHHGGEVLEMDKDSDYFAYGRVFIVPVALTGKVTLLSVERSQGNPSYRGTLELLREETGIYITNELLLEEYLYAVVPSEMPSNYPLEALKAQAVCARTYAYGHMLKASSKLYGAHVDDSSSYQVYNNVTEKEQTTTAVRETGGQLLYVPEDGEEKLADTYYYSTSCGFGTASDIWKGTAQRLSYLPAKRIADLTGQEESGEKGEIYTANSLMDEDIFGDFIRQGREEDYEVQNPWYRWSYDVEKIDTERMLSVLQSRYEADKELVLTRNKDGEFVSKPLKKIEKIVEISVIRRGDGGVADELFIETESQAIKVISEYNIRAVLCDGSTKVLRQDGSRVAANSLLPSAFFVITTGKEDGNVVGYTIVGGGFGHGVGMSQNGAAAMAGKGLTAEKILSFFYEGSKVKQIY